MGLLGNSKGLRMMSKAYMPTYMIQSFARAGGSRVVLKALVALLTVMEVAPRYKLLTLLQCFSRCTLFTLLTLLPTSPAHTLTLRCIMILFSLLLDPMNNETFSCSSVNTYFQSICVLCQDRSFCDTLAQVQAREGTQGRRQATCNSASWCPPLVPGNKKVRF